MAAPIYIKSLISLMKFLGWEQQAIAKRLGCSKTAVSLWAHGARPISQRYAQAFHDLVGTELRRARDAMVRESQENTFPEYSGLVILEPSARQRQLQAFIEQWRLEQYIKVGQFQRRLAAAFQTLRSDYAKVLPVDPGEEEAIREACQVILRHLDYSRRLDPAADPSRVSETPAFDFVEGFGALWAAYASPQEDNAHE